MKADSQAIYQAGSRQQAVAHARALGKSLQRLYPKVVQSLRQDLPELLAFFNGPRLWRMLQDTNSARNYTCGLTSPAYDYQLSR